jgi:basic membrane protein A
LKQLAKIVVTQLAWSLAILAVLYAIAALGRHAERRHDGGQQLRVALFVNGTLGDKSFFDSAARGMAELRRTMPVFTKVIEGGIDPTRWEGALTDLADSGDYDLIVVGTFTMVPYVQKLAQQFPAARFLLFDATVDYRACPCANVHSLLFRQNEGAYLAGFLAASLMEQGLPGIAPHSGLGVIGGMQIPAIDDFTIGFKAGAAKAAPRIAVVSQYANAFSDPAAGKEIAKAQYGQGAGLIFHAAGATGQGVNEAAAEAGRYVIGVDMDQYAYYLGAHPERAARIVTSVMKNVDAAIVSAVRRHLAGRLAYGSADSLGLAEGGVSLAMQSAVLDAAPRPLLARLQAVQADIVAGRVKAPGAFGKPVQ